MQEKDTEAVRNQWKRRKRISRIKNAVIIVIAGWMLISMLLILALLVKTQALEKKLNQLLEAASFPNSSAQLENDETEAVYVTEQSSLEKQQQAAAQTAAMSVALDTENLAAEDDIHKVYLTFDDGPSENTAEILDILGTYGVKATFFVTGREDEEAKELYRRIVEEGHTLGMHSYANRYSVIYQSQEAFEEDYWHLKDYLNELTHTECKYYRFPGGSTNQISNVPMRDLIAFLNEQGTIYYDWNVSAGDAASAAYTVEELVENVTGDIVKYKTSVVLLHDAKDKSTTVEALGPLIEALQELDAEILPIDEDTQVIQSVKADSVNQ